MFIVGQCLLCSFPVCQCFLRYFFSTVIQVFLVRKKLKEKEADGEKESQKDLQDKLKFRDFGEVATYWMYRKFSFDRKHIIKSINKSFISLHMPLSEIHLCTNNYSSFVM